MEKPSELTENLYYNLGKKGCLQKIDGKIENLYQQPMSYPDFIDENNMVVLCHDCHWELHYTDNHELSPYRWESATTIENTPQEKHLW